MTNLRIPAIYAIVCIDTGRMYIGRATNADERRIRHFWKLRNGKHDNKPLQRAWKKHGEASFEFRILTDLSDVPQVDLHETLNRHEIAAIAAAKRPYNKQKGGRKQPPISPETRAKLSAERKARWADPEYRARAVASMRKVAADPELQAKRGAAISAAKSTPEAREAQREVSNRRWAREGEKERFGQIHADKWADPAYKAHQVEMRKASWKDPEKRARRLEALKESWADPEVRARRQAAMVAGRKAKAT